MVTPIQSYVDKQPEQPRRSSEFYGNINSSYYKQCKPQGYNNRIFNPLQAPEEESESNSSSVEPLGEFSEDNNIKKEDSDYDFDDKSLNSEESKEILMSGSSLVMAEKQKHRLKSLDLGYLGMINQENDQSSDSKLKVGPSFNHQLSKSQVEIDN